MTPLSTLIRQARLVAIPTPAELTARAALPRQTAAEGISHAELAARCNALPGAATVYRSGIVRAERVGPREPLLMRICEALGLEVQLVAVREQRKRSKR